eukprot:CAMPEP_0202443506 /NCGR_PEP_ID=MMETSP1360-20130828/2739_1 /ASSEMBLY_ACC=CAM_ASM_000848 /TAXON_ID=515479 /ORGANISM="Licmophora paradoxa, Strain CCMP2313" /LENGTH=82 /DNA_ID=CAMNT_0049059199 /DNA_START=82 /DNA_END=330 /DNA_ORIENTATION=+
MASKIKSSYFSTTDNGGNDEEAVQADGNSPFIKVTELPIDAPNMEDVPWCVSVVVVIVVAVVVVVDDESKDCFVVSSSSFVE